MSPPACEAAGRGRRHPAAAGHVPGVGNSNPTATARSPCKVRRELMFQVVQVALHLFVQAVELQGQATQAGEWRALGGPTTNTVPSNSILHTVRSGAHLPVGLRLLILRVDIKQAGPQLGSALPGRLTASSGMQHGPPRCLPCNNLQRLTACAQAGCHLLLLLLPLLRAIILAHGLMLDSRPRKIGHGEALWSRTSPQHCTSILRVCGCWGLQLNGAAQEKQRRLDLPAHLGRCRMMSQTFLRTSKAVQLELRPAACWMETWTS